MPAQLYLPVYIYFAGNQLGEEGIEILNATLDCIGKLDALASLRYVKDMIILDI